MVVRCVGICVLLLGPAIAAGQEVTIKPEQPESGGSDLLRPPGSGSDPYAPRVDWNRLPAWKQTSFFGIRAQGKTFLYVVDCSGSMGDGGRLSRAKREIRRSVGDLRFPQRYEVIFYNDRPLPMPGGIPQSADAGSKATLANWMSGIDAEGETDPRGAMNQALSLAPDAIFLLSDGEFPKGCVEAIARKNPRKIPIHCIDMAGSSDDLKKIARDSGGQYAARPRD